AALEGGPGGERLDGGGVRPDHGGRRRAGGGAAGGGEPKPGPEVAKDPKRYQVSFLERKPGVDLVRNLEEVALAAERVVAVGREIYAWHPEGVARSKLWAQLAGKGLGVTATARNWSTVTKL